MEITEGEMPKEKEQNMPVVEPSTGVVPNIVDGVYNVECLSIVAEDITGDKFGNNAKLTIQLRFDELNYEDVYEPDDMPDSVRPGDVYVFKTRINRKWNELSTFYKWTIGFGLKANPDEPFDTDRLVGKRAQAQIGHDPAVVNGWPKIVAMIPTAGAKKGSSGSQEGRQPPEGAAVDADTASAWWKARLGEGFERPKVIDLCKEMFEGRIPGELTATELRGLTEELNRTA